MFTITKNILIALGGFALLGIGLILYLSLGLTVIQSYVNESNFKKTTCTVRAVEIHKMSSKEDWYRCPWKCTLNHTPDGLKTFCELSEFPCLRVVVDVATRHGLKSAIVHEDPTTMNKYPDCSTYFCDQDSVVNEKEVNKFRKRYGNIGNQYPCFYDQNSLQSDDYDDDGQEHALIKLTHGPAAYINSVFWPGVTVLAGLVLIVYGSVQAYIEKNKKKKAKRNAQDSEKRKMIDDL